MPLIPFSADHLRLDGPVPVALRDAHGRLLLPAGAAIAGDYWLAALRAQPLFADEAETHAWQRRLGAPMVEPLHRNASLQEIVHARADPPGVDVGGHEAPGLADAWTALATVLDAALHAAPQGAGWVGRLAALAPRVLALARRRTDASLFHLVQLLAEPRPRCSAHHALLVLVIADETGQLLGWDEPTRDTLARAALAMNVAVVRLQDAQALAPYPPTAEQRAAIDGHAALGAAWLEQGGADDPGWVEVVRRHHDVEPADATPLDEAAPAVRLARLLQRVDVYAAKIGARRLHPPLPAVQAAKEACLGHDGRPDEIGSALLRATGLYPPGTAVELADGERGLVVARGRRANVPFVASLVGASGLALGQPLLRDTIDARHAVRAALPAGALKVQADPERLFALR
jgi:hypothetical protein